MISTEGIILRRTPYLGANVILDLLTPLEKIPVILHAGRKSQAKYAETQVGSLVNVVLSHARGETMRSVREITADIASADITRMTPYRTAQSMFLCELTARTVKGGDSSEEIYHFLYQSIRSLCSQGEKFLCLRYAFHLARLLGFSACRPEGCTGRYFDLQAGEFLVQKPLHRYYLSPANAAMFFRLEDTGSDIVLPAREDYLKTWHILMTYYGLHVDGFQAPRSLEFLQQLTLMEHFGQSE